MFRKSLVCLLAFLFAFGAVASAQNTAGDTTIMSKVAGVETILYGSEQTGALVERVNKIEKDLYGVQSRDAIGATVDKIYTYITVTTGTGPSFVMKLNGVEWNLTHAVTNLPAKSRIENLERVLVGNTDTSGLDDRLNKLIKVAYATGQVDIASSNIYKDTLIKIKITSPLDTRQNRVGDPVTFEAADDVYSNGVLVIAKGAPGTGRVAEYEPAKNFGRDAKLVIAFDAIQGVDGSNVETFLGEKAKEETKSLAKAAGATVAGVALLGPIGIVGGAFVRGQDITIPAGSLMYIQVKADTSLYGLTVNK